MKHGRFVVLCALLAGFSGVPTANRGVLSGETEERGGEAVRARSAGRRPPYGPLLPDGPSQSDFPHLHHLLKLTERIYSGGEPQGEAAFDELARLGIRTVVSVDGGRPACEAAQRHGMRYVHIPLGYDGIPAEAGRALARLVREAEGPFYVHCHRGVHRGPAAAAIACIADGAADGDTAPAILERAGTSQNYAQLWRDVRSYKPPAAGEALPELVSIAEVGSLTRTMSQIERASDNLQLCQASHWRTPADHPDISPLQEALLLKEGFRELARQLQDVNDNGDQFLAWMEEAEAAAAQLESELTVRNAAMASSRFSALQSQCTRCHNEYRN